MAAVLIVILLVVPLMLGQLLDDKEDKYYIGTYLTGFVLMLAVFQILALGAFYLELPLHVLSIVFMCVLGFLCVLSAVRRKKKLIYSLQPQIRIRNISWCFVAAVILIVIQAVILASVMHIDQDDAFYVGTAVTSVNTDSIFQYDPYTGLEYAAAPSRYVLSPFPIFVAFLSQVSGIHAAIIDHTILPVFLIPLSYYVYWLIGKRLFAKKIKAISVFLLIVALFQMFSFCSIYTSGTFLLVRIWQGKAILANILLPAVLYLGLTAFRNSFGKKQWIILCCTLIASCMVSSMGIMLAAIMTGIIGIICAVWKKSLAVLEKFILCCFPNLVLAGIYILIR